MSFEIRAGRSAKPQATAGRVREGLGCWLCCVAWTGRAKPRSEEHTSELQSHVNLVCRLLLEKKKKKKAIKTYAKHINTKLGDTAENGIHFYKGIRADNNITNTGLETTLTSRRVVTIRALGR